MRRYFIPIVLSLSLLLSGCGMTGTVYSGYRALEQLRLVRTLGYDVTAEGVSLSASTGKQGESGEMLLLRRQGSGILKAMDSLQDYSTEGQLFFGHVQYLLLGREAAEAGLGPVLDFAERDLRIRLDTKLFILKDGEAGDLVMGPGGDSYDVTEALDSVRQDVELRGAGRAVSLRETAVALSEQGAALACLVAAAETEGSVKLDPPGLTAVPLGYAVLGDGGRLLGTLEGRTAEAVTLLLGGSGTVTRRVETAGGAPVTLQFDGAGGGVRVRRSPDGGMGNLEIKLKVRAAVAETDGSVTGGFDARALGDALSRSLEADLSAAFAQSQRLNADFLAVGPALRRSGADLRDLPENWLQALEAEISVETAVDRSYDLNAAVGLEGGAGTS